MTDHLAADLLAQAIYTLLVVTLPVLAIALVVSLVSAVAQSATTVQESTLSRVPRFVAVLLGLIIAGPWMMRTLTTFTVRLLGDFSRYIR